MNRKIRAHIAHQKLKKITDNFFANRQCIYMENSISVEIFTCDKLDKWFELQKIECYANWSVNLKSSIKVWSKIEFQFRFFSFSSAQNQMVVVVVFFLLLYVVIFLLYMQIDPFCAQIVLYTLSSNIHGAIPSIHTMNILNIFFILFFFSHI